MLVSSCLHYHFRVSLYVQVWGLQIPYLQVALLGHKDMVGHHIRVNLIVSVIGGTASHTHDAKRPDDVRLLVDFLRRLQQRYRHTPLTILTVPGSYAHQTVKKLGDEAPISSFQTVPSALSNEDQATFLCRFGHILLDLGTQEGSDSSTDQRTRHFWETQDFDWQETENDADQLLQKPDTGPVFVIKTSGNRKKIICEKSEWRSNEDGETSFTSVTRITSAHALFRDLNQLNKDCASIDAERANNSAQTLFQSDLPSVGAADESGQNTSILQSALTLFGKADLRAMALNTGIFWYNVWFAAAVPLAILAYELLNHFSDEDLSIVAYSITIFVTLLVWLWSSTRLMKQRQMNTRMLAELIRIRLFWSLAGIENRIEPYLRSGIRPEFKHAQLVSRWLDFKFNRAHFQSPEDIDFVITNWIGTTDRNSPNLHKYSQISWFTANEKKKSSTRKRLSAIQIGIYSLSVVLALAYLIYFKAFSNDFLRISTIKDLFGIFVINVLPVVAGGFSVIIERSGYARHQENYRRMAIIARNTRFRLDETDPSNIKQQKSILEQFGIEAIEESVEWMITRRLQSFHPVIGG